MGPSSLTPPRGPNRSPEDDHARPLGFRVPVRIAQGRQLQRSTAQSNKWDLHRGIFQLSRQVTRVTQPQGCAEVSVGEPLKVVEERALAMARLFGSVHREELKRQ